MKDEGDMKDMKDEGDKRDVCGPGMTEAAVRHMF